MTTEQKNRNISGIICGLGTFLVWYMVLLFIYEPASPFHNLDSALFQWIVLGPVPLFLGGIVYCFTQSGLSEVRRAEQVAAIKGIIVGYLLWIPAIFIVPPQACDNGFNVYPVVAGYLLMLVFALAFQKKSGQAGS